MKSRVVIFFLFFLLMLNSVFAGSELPDIHAIQQDLTVPCMTDGEPVSGKRVKQTLPEYRGTEIYHVLYLPIDWEKNKQFPVIVEYAGNGSYSNKFGDISTGRPEHSKLGYGVSGGKGFIWVCLPYISKDHKRNQLQWWGDVDATVDYCKKAVREICAVYGGDRSSVILAGFSRGAIACNYVGLHDDEIADIWRAFIVHSHYDGVRRWGYAEDDEKSALVRLQRLHGRAQFISHEVSANQTKGYLECTGVKGAFTFLDLPYRNHTDSWVLRDIPERRMLRDWLKSVLEKKSGM
ncbi:MAG: hypothetical protein PHR77_15005 [Kiritimatiellae bacterium]|nr:hypothetical protein [Kiritimatiellia bacterium]MDD5520242.1 hypothetical protein [Kiritimatiellia bacterium]